MYRIEVNGLPLEAPDAAITLNFQRSKIGELAIEGSGSQTINVPKTLHNISIFEYCNFIESESVFPYSVKSARCYQDEALIVDNAELTIMRVTPSSFECALTWGNSPLLNALKSKFMCEIPLGVYRKFPLSEKQPIDVKIYGEAFFFQTQDNEGVITDHYTTFRDVEGLYRDALTSRIEAAWVLKQILDGIGFGYEILGYVERVNFGESHVVATAKSATIPKFLLHSRITDRTIDIGRWEDNFNKLTEYKRLYGDDPEAYHVDEPYAGQIDDPTYYQEMRDYYIPQDGYYDLRVVVSYKQGQVGEPDGHGGLINQSASVNLVFAGAQGYLYDNGTGFDRAIRSTQPDLSDTQDIRGDQTRMWIDADEVDGLAINKRKQFYKKGRHAFWLIGEGGLQTTYELARFTEVNVELSITRHNDEDTEVIDEQECYLDHNFTYRDATAYEVLSQTLKAFGFLAEIDPTQSDPTLSIYSYNLIAEYAAAGNSSDWTDKVMGMEQSIQYNLNLPQFLSLKWKPEAQYDGGRDGQKEILSAQAGSAEYITNSIYSACNGMHTRFLDPYSIPLLNYMSRKTDNPSVRELTSYTSGAKMVKIIGNYPFDGTPLYLNDSAYIPIDGEYLLLADDSYFDYSDTINGIGYNFKTLLDALYKIVCLEVPMRLTPSDIANLDFKKPIFLQQYNAYFALEKVQYGENGISKVELLKLNLQ